MNQNKNEYLIKYDLYGRSMWHIESKLIKAKTYKSKDYAIKKLVEKLKKRSDFGKVVIEGEAYYKTDSDSIIDYFNKNVFGL